MNLSPITMSDSAAPATPAAPDKAPAESAFDVILALETLAAAPQIDAALEELDLPADAETDVEDSDGEDLLAILGSLSMAAPLTGQAAAGSQAKEVSVDALGQSAGGSAGDGGTGDAAALTARGAESADSGSSGADKLLAAQGLAGAMLDSQAAALTDQNGVDASSASTRGAEWMQPAARHAAGADQNQIATPVRDPRWVEDFGTRVALMVRGGESSASLQLSPVELGPLDVSVTVRDSQATIHFGAAQAETRALIESSIPRLREMLAAQGFQLMDTSVSQGFARQARPEPQSISRGSAEGEVEPVVTRSVQALGLLDLYA